MSPGRGGATPTAGGSDGDGGGDGSGRGGGEGPTAVGQASDGLAIVRFGSAAALERWLEANHGRSPGVWLQLAKKGSGMTTVTYAEAVEAGLCFGWIDSQKGRLDDRSYLQRFTPRGPRSPWSKINRDKAEALLAAGRVRPSGVAAIEAARADGRWDAAYAGQRTAAVPADLQAALDADPAAAAFFATVSSANRYAVIWRVEQARRPETRAARIERFVAMLARGETLH